MTSPLLRRVLPKDQDANMPKMNIVEERGKKWIKPHRIPEGLAGTYGIPQATEQLHKIRTFPERR